MNTPILEVLQEVAVNALAADPMFAGELSANGQPVPIVLEKKGDIQTQIDTAIAQVGICAVVLTPEFELINPLLGDLAGFALMTVDVFEVPPVNQGNGGTQILGIALASRVVAILHWLPTNLPITLPGGAGEEAKRIIALPKPIVMGPGAESVPIHYEIGFRAYVILP
jgi:hypothetical protein